MSDIKLDVLAFGAHPDDVEITCGGLLCRLVDAGRAVGIIDLTRGELGTRGTAEIRTEEAKAAAKIIGKTALLTKRKPLPWKIKPLAAALERRMPNTRANRYVNTPASHNWPTVNQP